MTAGEIDIRQDGEKGEDGEDGKDRKDGGTDRNGTPHPEGALATEGSTQM